MATVFRSPYITPPRGYEYARSQNWIPPNLLPLNVPGPIVYSTGFEVGGDADQVALLGSTSSIQTALAHGGRYALQQDSFAPTQLVTGLNISQSSIAFYFYITAAPAFDLTIAVPFNGLLAFYSLKITASLQTKVIVSNASNGVITQTGTATLTTNGWNRISANYDKAVNGAIQVWVNGVLDINTTHTIATSNVNGWQVQGAISPTLSYFDDIVVVQGMVPPDDVTFPAITALRFRSPLFVRIPLADPQGIARNAQSYASGQHLFATQAAKPFSQPNWPKYHGPPYPISLRQNDPQPLKLTTLAAPSPNPFNQRHWPNPLYAHYPRDLRFSSQSGFRIPVTAQVTSNIGFRSPTYSNQWKAFWRSDLYTITQGIPQVIQSTISLPFSGLDVSNPEGYPYPIHLRNFVPQVSIALATTRTRPFAQLDWPNPQGPIRQIGLNTWLQASPPALTTAGVNPFTMLDWPLPQGYIRAADLNTFLQATSLSLQSIPVAPPFYMLDWPLPQAPLRPWDLNTFLQQKPFYYQDQAPSKGIRRSYQPLTRSSTSFQIIDASNRILAGNLEMPTTYEIQPVLEGFAVEVDPNRRTLILEPSGALNAGTVVLPETAIDRDLIRIATTQTITALTVMPGTGQTLLNAPTSLSAGASIAFVYSASNLTWYRLH